MPIPRLHLFELHEQSWFPTALRDGVTDGLYTIWKLMFWQNTLPHLQDLLHHAQGHTILDLCSGAGGPLPLATEHLQKSYPDLSIILSDINPHAQCCSSSTDLPIHYHPAPVNAMAAPKGLGQARTLFEAFHHFKPEAAVAILRDAVTAQQPIAIFEFQRRELWDTILPPMSIVPLVGGFLSWKHTPFRWTKLFATLIPLIPLTLILDGIVSMLRTYTAQELAELAQKAGTNGYRWEVRQSQDRGMGRMTCLIGWPSEGEGVFMVPSTP